MERVIMTAKKFPTYRLLIVAWSSWSIPLLNPQSQSSFVYGSCAAIQNEKIAKNGTDADDIPDNAQKKCSGVSVPKEEITAKTIDPTMVIGARIRQNTVEASLSFIWAINDLASGAFLRIIPSSPNIFSMWTTLGCPVACTILQTRHSALVCNHLPKMVTNNKTTETQL